MHRHMSSWSCCWATAICIAFIALACLQTAISVLTAKASSQPAFMEQTSSSLLYLFHGHVTTIVPGRKRCVPAACFAPKHFVTNATDLLDPLGFTYLASFPGSGNTFTRIVIQEGTRLWTASTSFESDLRGFDGEMIDAFKSPFPSMAVVKTHFPGYFNGPVYIKPLPYAIVIMRSPFDALLAEYNRQLADQKRHNWGLKLDIHVASTNKKKIKNNYHKWFPEWSKKWLTFSRFWLGDEYWLKPDWPQNKNYATTPWFVSEAPYRELDKTFLQPQDVNKSAKIFVMFYEDLVRDFTTTSRALFSFLKISYLGNAMPSVEDAMTCVMRFLNQTEAEHRVKKNFTYNPYLDVESPFVFSNLTRDFCSMAKKLFYADKWGECELALNQNERILETRKVSAAPPQEFGFDENSVCEDG